MHSFYHTYTSYTRILKRHPPPFPCCFAWNLYLLLYGHNYHGPGLSMPDLTPATPSTILSGGSTHTIDLSVLPNIQPNHFTGTLAHTNESIHTHHPSLCSPSWHAHLPPTSLPSFTAWSLTTNLTALLHSMLFTDINTHTLCSHFPVTHPPWFICYLCHSRASLCFTIWQAWLFLNA